MENELKLFEGKKIRSYYDENEEKWIQQRMMGQELSYVTIHLWTGANGAI